MVMVIDDICYDYVGCHTREMFQLIEIQDYWDENDTARWPEPTAYHDLDLWL